MTSIKNENAIVEAFQFSATSQEMRSVLIQGEPWIIAKDVCDILGYSKYRDAISKLDDDERCPVLVDTLGGTQKMTAISESAVYALILRSNKPEAKIFRKWVTSEVLPAIRKKGYYGANTTRQGDYLDLRDVPYTQQLFNESSLTAVEYNGESWYSINDVHRAIGSRTGSAQTVKRLNVKCILAKKILLYGCTQPAWFTNTLGVQLILSGSQVLKSNRQLTLNF